MKKTSALNFKTLIIIVFACLCLYFAYQGLKFVSIIVAVVKIAESHVEGNVPSEVDFDKFLKRDLKKYFQPNYGDEIKVEYHLLRKKPTQTGIAHPKYYLWVSISKENNELIEQGAARIAAINKIRFEITHFFTIAEIKKDKSILSTVFPQDICKKIEQKIDE